MLVGYGGVGANHGVLSRAKWSLSFSWKAEKRSEGCELCWTCVEIPAQPLSGCVPSGSSLTSLCLSVSPVLGRGIPRGEHRQRLGGGTSC